MICIIYVGDRYVIRHRFPLPILNLRTRLDESLDIKLIILY